MSRVLTAARLHLVNPLVMLGIPWLVAGISFAINLALFGLTDAGADMEGGGFTAGVASLYITVLIVFVQAVTQLLPFAMGLSLSRRTFYLGTALVAVVQSLCYGVVLAALVAVEGATGGWGVDLAFWGPGTMDVDAFALQVVVSGGPMLAATSVGIGIGVVMKRWGQRGLWALIVGTLVVLGGLAVLVTWLEAWGDLGTWFGDRAVATLAAGVPAILAAALAALSWAGIRRTVP
ncbi:hypothetical protein [Trujillonella endophytica]|uniref:ABC-2 type transport system permease protein n=1 Tax=Trujillonella endophytica TaxID=673521 RepID=A0A1H8WQS6_9ACTN|nr:hypothetical protein [Trujillella endophytica]SEP30040.1 hypothetical protein SAMN05660991_04652 [Trujillella endophytica]